MGHPEWFDLKLAANGWQLPGMLKLAKLLLLVVPTLPAGSQHWQGLIRA
jgi:hypothetical protein